MSLLPLASRPDALTPSDWRHAKAALETRRHFLGRTTQSFGAAALAGLIGDSLLKRSAAAEPATPAAPAAPVLDWARGQPGTLAAPHFPGKAKRVIYIHMAGAPPHLDLFDYKPLLNTWNQKEAPESLIPKRAAFLTGKPKILGTPFQFEQTGQNGLWLSELLPHFKTIVDDVCVIRSLCTDQFNHAPAQLLMHTGFPVMGRPSMGAWTTYGLGSENANLPAFIVLLSGGKAPDGGVASYGSGFLPSVYQGVQCRSKGDPVLYLSDPKGMSRDSRRQSLDALAKLNRIQHASVGDPETLSRIAQYEMAFRMQASVPEVMDIKEESKETLEAYGATPGQASFANNCLLARKLCEAGVRYIQLFDWGWDVHGTGPGDDLIHKLPEKCRETDKPVAALIKDLKQRGLLEDTVVVWSGEFGRTAMNEARNGSTHLGRDHYPSCFTVWVAGGGFKSGFVHGATNEWGTEITDGKMDTYDLQATILASMGVDHTRLTHRFQGLDFRLTNFRGNINKTLLS